MTVAWYVAKVRRGREGALAQQLVPEGVELYHPEIIAHKNGRRRREPLFPSYLFFKADPQDDAWVLVRRARGLKYILGADRQPTAVDSQIVEALRARVEQWNAGGWRSIFLPGEKVLVSGGPMTGLEVIFLQYLPSRERCRILIAAINTQHAAEIAVSSLTNAARAASYLRLRA